MPKKFGTNTKAQEANERKASAKKETQEKDRKAKEDAQWAETDKHALEKEKKKKEAEDKKAAEALRKAQNKELLAKENEELDRKSKNQPKLTRAEIEKQKQIEEFARKKLEKEKEKKKEDEIPENVNKIIAQEKEEYGEDYIDARTVHEAIGKLSVGEEEIDRHPEKRMKALYLAFEEKRLPEVRAENPSLRLTQLKDIVWKEWQKSPENPNNRAV